MNNEIIKQINSAIELSNSIETIVLNGKYSKSYKENLINCKNTITNLIEKYSKNSLYNDKVVSLNNVK